MLQGLDKEHKIYVEHAQGALRGNDAMRFVFRKTRPCSCCNDAWTGGAPGEAGKPEGKEP